MGGLLIGYARCSTRGQDLRAQQHELRKAGVAEDRIYTDAGFTGRNTDRPGLKTALAVVREGDTLVVTKLDRLGRSILDLHKIANELTEKGVKLSWGGTTYNPLDPAGKLFFSMLAAFAEFAVIWTLRGLTAPGCTKPRSPTVRMAAGSLSESYCPRVLSSYLERRGEPS